MQIQQIACDKIEFPTANEDLRTFRPETAQQLAQNIEEQGMHHPIAVRPNPAKPDYYLGVHGRRRHYARAMILKHPFIECNVFDMSDEEAEAASFAENLFRLGLSQPQKTRAIKKLREIYIAKHPEQVGKGKAGGAAMKRKAQGRKKAKAKLVFASEENEEESQSEAPGGEDEEAGSFPKAYSAMTGVSETTAKREQQLAVNLTERQLSLCEELKLNKGQMESLASIKSNEERDQVLLCVSLGRKFDDAWREVDPGGEMATGKPRSREAAAEQEMRPELSDDEWFDQFCAEKAASLGSPAGFKANALLFRRITRYRHLFRAEVEGTLNDAKAAKVTGPFYDLVDRFVSAGHPKNWPLCGGCVGSGRGRNGAGCTTCHRAGYLLKSLPEGLTNVAEGNHEDRAASPGKEPATNPLNAVSPPGRVHASNGKTRRPVKPEPEVVHMKVEFDPIFDEPVE